MHSTKGGVQFLKAFVRQLGRLPWTFIILFDVAALTALLFAGVMVSTQADAHKVRPSPQASQKRIAISLDDAPRGAGAFLDPNVRPQLLIAALRDAGVRQAVFFVNPGRIEPGSANEASIRAYEKAGHVVANHTATHLALGEVSVESFVADIDKAESWLEKEPGHRRWFRFPRLDEGGRDTVKRDAVRAALKARGLRNGYVTADGWDWYMEELAIRAKARNDRIDYAALRDLYVETNLQAAEFADKLARRTLGRAPAQVLLLHETDLATLYLPDLARALRANGWTIITADEAYADPMGKLPPPVIADANGTLIQMLSWEHGTKGPRWFERNEIKEADRLFNERVLHRQ